MKNWIVFSLLVLMPSAAFSQKTGKAAIDTVLILPVAVKDTFPDSLRWIPAAFDDFLGQGIKTMPEYFPARMQSQHFTELPGTSETAKWALSSRARWVIAVEIFSQKNMTYFHWALYDAKKPKEISVTLLSERADDPAAILTYPEKILTDLLKLSGKLSKPNTKKISERLQISKKPNAVQWYYAALSLEMRNGNLDSAESWLQHSVQIDAGFRQGYEQLARIQIRQRRYDPALGTYQSLIRLDTSNADYYRAVGDIYYYNKDQLTLARQNYQTAVRLNPKDIKSWIQSGYCYYVKKEYELAAVQARQAAALEPGNSEALNLLGLCSVSLGDTAQAVTHFRAAVDSNPKETAAKKNLARIYEQRGQAGDALKLYQSITLVDSSDALAFASLSQLYFNRKDTLHAITAYIQAALLRPELENTKYNAFQPFPLVIGSRNPADALRRYTDSLATLLLDAESGSRDDYVCRVSLGYIQLMFLNRPSEAINHLQVAQLTRPDVPRLSYLQGEAFYAMEKYSQALKLYNAYLNTVEDKDNYARTILMIGKTLIRQKRYEEAELEILKSIRLHPNAESYYLYGVILRALQKYDEAVAQFQKAISLYPKYLDAYIDLGQIYYRKNNIPMALETYQKAAVVDSQNISLRQALTMLYITQGNFIEAEKHILFAIKQGQATGARLSDVQGLYGEWYYRQKKFDEASKQFQNQIKSDSNSAEGYYRLACIASIKKDEKNTLKWMELALKKGYMRFSEIDKEAAFENMKKSRKFSDLIYDYRKRMEDALIKNLKQE